MPEKSDDIRKKFYIDDEEDEDFYDDSIKETSSKKQVELEDFYSHDNSEPVISFQGCGKGVYKRASGG